MQLALGLIETKGLIGAIEAADAMAKAANVKILNKEKSTAALITIKIEGEVAAVKSAVDAGAAAAQRVGQLVSAHVIARPSEEIDFIISQTDSISVPTESEFVESTSAKKVSPKIKKKQTESIQPPVIQKQKPAATESAPESETSEESTNIDSDPKNISVPEIPLELSEENVEELVSDTEVVEEDTAEENAAEEVDKVISQKMGDSEDKPEEEIESDSDEEFDFNKDDSESSNVISHLEKLRLEAKLELENEHILDGDKESDDSPDNIISEPEDLNKLNVHELRKLARTVENFPIKGREISKANRNTLLGYFKSL